LANIRKQQQTIDKIFSKVANIAKSARCGKVGTGRAKKKPPKEAF